MKHYNRILLVAVLLTAIGISDCFPQYTRNYRRVTPSRNYSITKYDTLQVKQCYQLDNANAIGVVFRYWRVDMWMGVFRNNRTDAPVVEYDTINVTDSTRFHFYQTSNPGDGTVIIWESRYDFYSEMRAYLYKNGELKKLGKIDIDLADATVDKLHYPVSDIAMSTDGHSIKMFFRSPLTVRLSRPADPKNFYYIWDGINQLLPVFNEVIERPLW